WCPCVQHSPRGPSPREHETCSSFTGGGMRPRTDESLTEGPVLTTLPHRLIGASALDVGTYEEVEADRGATTQALLVVLASSLAGGIGASGFLHNRATLVEGAFLWSAISLVAWAAWALLVFEIGGRLLPEPQ